MTNKKILYIVLAVLLFGAVGSGAYMMGRQTAPIPTPTHTLQIQETLAPSPTQMSTPSPSPTVTPTKKPTPTPSNTPTPSPTPTPGVVNIETSVAPITSNACSQTFNFSAKIYTNAAMSVKYKWLRSDNAIAGEQTLTYSEAGMQTVTSDWTLSRNPGDSYSGWKRIEITSPGSGLSNKAEFTLSCP